MRDERTRSSKGYRVERLGAERLMVVSASTVNRSRNTIHFVTNVDVTDPRRLISAHRERTGESLSFTAYVVACFARTLADFPNFNSFRKGRRLVVLDECTVSVLLEREIEGESIPEPIPIEDATRKSYRQIHDELRASQHSEPERLGDASGFGWVTLIPPPLMRLFIRVASRNIRMQQRFGTVGVTSIGMFARGPLWLVPLTSATVTVAVGGIEKRPALVEGAVQEREYLCLTLSFDHDVVDGAPAARFARCLSELLASSEVLHACEPPLQHAHPADSAPEK